MMQESCVEMTGSRGTSLFIADESDDDDKTLQERLSLSVAPSGCLL